MQQHPSIQTKLQRENGLADYLQAHFDSFMTQPIKVKNTWIQTSIVAVLTHYPLRSGSFESLRAQTNDSNAK